MKGKKQYEEKAINKKNSGKLVDKKAALLFACLIILYFFYMKSKDSIINYPSWLYYGIFFIIVISVGVLCRNKFYSSSGEKKKTTVSLLIGVAYVSIVSWLIAGVLLIPFNYYNLHIAKSNGLEHRDCIIKKVSAYSKNRTIFYELDGRTNAKYAYKPIMEEIMATGDYDEYVFVANVRKGLFSSYILVSWDIRKR